MMDFKDFSSLAKERRSIRYFSEKKVTREEIEKILQTAILAPSVENIQPWHFDVIMDPQLKSKLMETSCYGNFVEGASVFVVVSCNRAAQVSHANAPIWNPREMEYSCVAAMNTAMFAAESMGIGSCWVSLHHGPAHNLLKLKDYFVVVGGLMFGYPKEGEEHPSGEHQRHAFSDVVDFKLPLS